MAHYPPREEIARQQLRKAESDVYEYLHGHEFDHEHFKQLSDAVVSAREEVLRQFSTLWAEHL